MSHTKIIFLDIDGVLNSQRYYATLTHEEHQKQYDKYGDGFDPLSYSLLNKLINATGAQVVISSTWRLVGEDMMREMWKARKMAGKIHGITPDFWQQLKPKGEQDSISIPRGCEIKWYLENKLFFHHWCRGEDTQYANEIKNKCTLSHYVILDDDTDMLYEQRNNFVKCTSKNGFTQEEYDKAFLILNGGLT